MSENLAIYKDRDFGKTLEKWLANLTYASVFVLAVFLFTSFSASALHHIFILFPGLYFCYHAFKTKRDHLHSPQNPFLSNSAFFLLVLVIISVISVILNSGFQDYGNSLFGESTTSAIIAIKDPIKNIFKLKYFVLGLLGIFAYRDWFNHHFSEKRVKWVLNTFVLSVTVASASGLIALYTGFNPLKFKDACHPDRTCGMYGMYMTYAYGMQFVLIILVGLWLYRNKITHYGLKYNLINMPLLYIALFVNSFAFFLSQARGATLGLIIALPFFFFKKNKLLFGVVLGILLLAGTVSYFTVPKVQKIWASDTRIYSIKRRVSLFKAATKAFYESPLLGIGYKNFERNSLVLKKRWNLEMQGFRGHGHSNFFEHLASTGLLGLLALIGFHLFWLIESYKRDDIVGNIMFPLVIALIVSGQVQYTLGDGENLFLIMFLYAIGQSSSFRKNEN